MWYVNCLTLITNFTTFSPSNVSSIGFNFYEGNLALPVYSGRTWKIQSFTINQYEIDLYASQLVEKWIEELGLHYGFYVSLANPPAVQAFFPRFLPRNSILTHKKFSGDVSGMLGEILYLAYIEKVLGLKSSETLHLRSCRPATTNNLIKTNDFYTYTTTQISIEDTLIVPPNSIILGEAKAIVNPKKRDIENRLNDAYKQINDTIIKLIKPYAGTDPILVIITVALRDYINATYKLIAVVMRV